ncbi:MAG: hypothetical protein IJ282_07900 [Lachnospiraceae bacterium]|nr:hypothetical protein [Lachnospiraceae bacterium]
MEWEQRDKVNELELPYILVKDSIDFTFDRKAYQTVNKEGNIIIRQFSTDIIPFNLELRMEIHAKSQAQCDELTNCLLELYTSPQEFIVTLPMHENEEFHFSIHYDKETSDSKQKIREFRNKRVIQDDNICISELCFYSIPCVYFNNEENRVDVSNNRRLQINLLKLATFYGECSKKLYDLDLTNYTCLTQNGSLFNFLLPQDLKTLKNCYQKNLPLDKDLFTKVFSKIIEFYPNIYDKAVQRWSKRQVWEDTRNYSKLFDQKCNGICTFLNIHFEELKVVSPSSPENLRAYIELMQTDKNMSLSEAIATIEEEIIEERMNVEIDTSNSGGGILSGLAHQAIESHNIKNHAGDRTRRDLIGLSGCAKTQGGTCSTCNLRFSCSRYF